MEIKNYPSIEMIVLSEDKMIDVVEQCLNDVKDILTGYFRRQKRLLPQLARDVLVNGFSAGDARAIVLNEKDMYRLQNEITAAVEKAVKAAGLYITPRLEQETAPRLLCENNEYLCGYAGEIRTTLCISTAANIISELLCESWLSRSTALIPGFNLVSGILNVISLQSVFKRARDEYFKSTAELERRLNGLLDSLHKNLENELTLRIATMLYDLEENNVRELIPA